MSTSAKTAMRLIARIADERARRARTPRRGIATYYPMTPPPTSDMSQGSPAELAGVAVMPLLSQMIGGYTPRVQKGAIIHDYLPETQEIGVRVGQPQPRIEDDADTISSLLNQLFASGGMPGTGA